MAPYSSGHSVATKVLGEASWLDVAKAVWHDAHARAASPADYPTQAWAIRYIGETYPHCPKKKELRDFSAWLKVPEFSVPPSDRGRQAA